MPHQTHVHAGLLRETFPGECRVALTPEDVGRLARRMAVSFEPECGAAAGYDDEAYIAAGARPAALESIAADCTVVVSVRRPQTGIAFARAVALVFLGEPADLPAGVRASGTAALELDLRRLEGVADAGSMDVATAQATITGHAAVLEGIRQLGVGHPMLVMDGNLVRPLRMATVGADAAALQAIATARRLGALTHACGFGDHDRNKVERLGAKYIAMDPALLRQPMPSSSSEQADLRQQLASRLAQMQLVVTSVRGAGQDAPVLIDEQTLATLSPGTVVIDLAAAYGGNCSMTSIGRSVTSNGVRVLGSTTFASGESNKASRLFSEGVSALLERLTGNDSRFLLDGQDMMISHLTGWRIDTTSMAS
jgi:NAD(P) transhydrogenase subunit alpha